MIVNETTLSQKNAVFLTKCIIRQTMKSKHKRFAGLVLLTSSILAILFFVLCIVSIITADKYGLDIQPIIYVETVVSGVIGFTGLFGFLFANEIALWRVQHSKEWPTIFEQSVRTVFEQDAITTYRAEAGTDTQSRYAYQLIEGYIEQHDSLYILISSKNQKKMIVLSDHGYTEGTKEEVLLMLRAKGIPMIQMP